MPPLQTNNKKPTVSTAHYHDYNPQLTGVEAKSGIISRLYANEVFWFIMYGTQGGWGHCSGVSPLWLLIHNTIAGTHTHNHNHTVAEGGGIEETIKYICPAYPSPPPPTPPRWKLSTSVRTIDWEHGSSVAGSRWGQTVSRAACSVRAGTTLRMTETQGTRAEVGGVKARMC